MVKKAVKPQKEENDRILVLKNQLARALADYDNLRKRSEEEKISWIKFATQKFIQDLLPVLDIFETVQEHLQDSGLAIAINQLKEVLGREGVVEIKPKAGDIFDENSHEVVEAVEGKEEGRIAEVVTSGWKLIDGNVIRHAKVKVFKIKKDS